jgi:alpha-glucosidase
MPQVFGKLPTVEQNWTEIGAIEAFESTAFGIACQCTNAILSVSVLSDTLVRVRVAPKGTLNPRRSWAVTLDDCDWNYFSWSVKETEDAIELKTPILLVRIYRNPCRVVCYDPSGCAFAEDIPAGIAWFTTTTSSPTETSNRIAAWKKIEADEHFYGFGERTGLLDKLAECKTNWTVDALDYDALTDEMYQAIPFFFALRPKLAYGIFFNTTFWSQFDLGAEQPGIWRMETASDELDYYIIYGPEPAQILETYTQLTGRMPLPPRWALGYHQCRWSYDSEAVVRDLAQQFRDRQIPCDVIHLDIDYMQGFRVFTWSPRRFSDPAKLIGDLRQDGFKTITIVDPGVKYEPDGDYAIFHQGVEQDYFVRRPDGSIFHGYVWPDKAVFPDFLRAEVREWWGNWQKNLTETGVAGIWNDMNEPALDDRPFGDNGNKISFPLDANQGTPDECTTHAEAHNLYGYHMAQASYEGLQRLRPNDRSFVLTRSGYAGIQRWSAVWTGDNQSQWEHLEMSLPMLCNLGLSGVAFVGADIGGFAGNATAELFARWMQVGMLYPLMRGHSAMKTAQHEPWVFGDRTEQICREYIELRYRLLPYLYTLFWQAATTGAPILRPLLYHYPNDPKTYALHDQVLLGENLMAAPVYRPGVEYRAVYLPQGTWYDWWSGDRYEGETHILAHAPLERMPLYVRAGTIIPMQPVMQYTNERPIDHLTLRIWQGMGEYTLYEDDGQSFEYQNGAWCTTRYRVHVQDGQTIVQVAEREGNWTPPDRQITLELVGIGEQQFQDDGQEHRFVFE